MVMLIRLLAKRGHDVSLLIYHPFYHFAPLVRDVGIEPQLIPWTTKIGRCFAVRRQVQRTKPHVIISFLDTPGLLGVFSSLPPRRIPVIVSERSWNSSGADTRARLRFNVYRLSDQVVTNSHSQADFIRNYFGFLTHKLRTIVNCVDTEQFSPRNKQLTSQTRIIVVSTVSALKNAHGLIEAVSLIRNSPAPVDVSVDWYGRNPLTTLNYEPDLEYFQNALALIGKLNLGQHFRFLGPSDAIHHRYPDYDCFCLPSLYEGCPNAVCEAMACGLPVLVSDVGDNRWLVPTIHNGLRFDPRNPNDLARKIREFTRLSAVERERTGAANREFAVRQFSQERFADAYENVIEEVLS
jgi:glycosyltransferase involved in cell wall biosynthesis